MKNENRSCLKSSDISPGLEKNNISMTLCVCPQRPVAMQCVRQMQEPSFPCLRYVLPCESHSQLFLSQLQGYSAVFWDGGKDDRFVSSLKSAQVALSL